jgi:nucleoside-diphosphate-sugar epimerase
LKIEDHNRKTAFVTGGTGFTGGHLCRVLVEAGYVVKALVRDPDSEAALKLCRWGVELYPGDLNDRALIAKALEGVDQVYHIAALFRKENVTRQDMWEANVQGLRNVLEEAEQAGVKRFVHCSTIGVHGDVKEPPGNEETPFNPGDAYQETKLEGELLAQEFMRSSRMPVTIFRPAGIYGPGDLRFLKLVKSIRRGWFFMIGSGEVLYNMVYIDDLVDGILLCGNLPEAEREVFILGGNETFTLNHLVKTIAEIQNVPAPRRKLPFRPVYAASLLCELVCKPLNIHPPLYRRRVNFFKKTRAFDISKARQKLGFHPRTSLATGLQRTIGWYEKKRLL